MLPWFFSTNHNSLLRIVTNEIASFYIDHILRRMAVFSSLQSGQRLKGVAKYFEINKSFICSHLFRYYIKHVAARLFSNRSQMTSKSGKNLSDTLDYASCATFLFLPHFDVICDLLLNRRTATWNLFVTSNSLVISKIIIKSMFLNQG